MEELIDKQLQSNIGKLLAQENIDIRHENVRTATFDTVKRVLTLPMYKEFDKDTYDMFIAHEVGHALWTAQGYLDDFKVNPTILNVIEDVRIEKKIQEKYLGLFRTFKNGRKVLFEKDFFKLSEVGDLKKLNIIDKINLHAKIGDHVDVEFTDEEQVWWDKANSCETWADVLKLSAELGEWMKDQQKKQEEEKSDDNLAEKVSQVKKNSNNDSAKNEKIDNNLPDFSDSEEDSINSESSEEGEADNSSKSSSGSKSSEEGEADNSSTSSEQGDSSNSNAANSSSNESSEKSEAGSETDESNNGTQASNNKIESVTNENFENSVQENSYGEEEANKSGIYVFKLPTLEKLKGMIYDNNNYLSKINHLHGACQVQLKTRMKDYKKNLDKKVSVILAEFERKKAAERFSKSRENRTGKLNLKKLHNYKISNDIFLSNTVLKDSQSHGVVMFLDFSSSMMSQLKSVLEQTITLSLFCRRANIPFRVYSFTTGGVNGTAEYNDGDLWCEARIVEMLTSDSKKADFEKIIDHMVRMIHHRRPWNAGTALDSMGCTPLNETLIRSIPILEEFKKMNRIQKLHTIVLTDGESAPAHIIGHSNRFSKLITTVNGQKYSFDSNKNSYCSSVLENLRNIPGNKVTLFYLPNGERYLYNFLSYTIKVDCTGLDLNKTQEFKEKNGADVVYTLPVNFKIADFSDDDMFENSNTLEDIEDAFISGIGMDEENKIFLRKIAVNLA